MAYILYIRRHPLVQSFIFEESEDQLYHLVSDYLQRDNLQALPNSQRSLMTLVLRKLLASSTFAIAGALDTISRRLQARLGRQQPAQSLEEEFDQDYEAFDETAEEWPEDTPEPEPVFAADRAALEQEIADLEAFRNLAVSITHNAKGKALLIALDRAFADADRLGAARKAIVFTESRRTQEYLLRVLADSPYAEGIVLFNGSNTDAQSRQIYADWLQRHMGTDRVSGSRTADLRSALVDYFREQGQIMIATEAGAEGINLQFCSLVVNYDLPWNSQRIEQRIGRCHRYGQKHDVVVVNFLNQTNAADQRVFQLLSEKFSLFEGVFGASDEVLGAIESGVDFEKRIAGIYQRCRTPEEIKASFDQLQLELNAQIDDAITHTRQQLLENFDVEVHEKLRVNLENSRSYLNRYERLLMQLTRYELGAHAEFLDGESAFRLKSSPFPDAASDIPLGLYELPRRSGEAHLYRLGHPLAARLILQAKSRVLPVAEVAFNYAAHDARISILESILGCTGWLQVTGVTIEALDQAEDHLLFTAFTDENVALDYEQARRLFSLPAVISNTKPAVSPSSRLAELSQSAQDTLLRGISARNAAFFEAEAKKLDAWADDQIASAERALTDTKRHIRYLRNQASKAPDLDEQARLQTEIRDLERRQRKLRQEIFDVEDQILTQRDQLLEAIRGKLQQSVHSQPVFTVRWSLNGSQRSHSEKREHVLSV